jgi:hypothetical protein
MGSERIPWGAVRGIEIDKGIITIDHEDRQASWSKVEAHRIPNLQVFLAMVDQVVRDNR